jgi:methionyl-tRNA synthetase
MTIDFDTFKNIELRVGTVLSVERVPDTDKLLRLTVDLGEEASRQIVSGIATYVSEDDLLGKQFCFVTNLEPRTIRGLESQGMILATGEGETFSLVSPTKPVSPGSLLR